MGPGAWAVVIVAALVFAVIGESMGAPKGYSGAGFFLGLLFGPIGLVIIAVMGRTPADQARYDESVEAASTAVSSPSLRACPWCAEQIQRAAIVCKHCGRDVETGMRS